MFFGLIEQMFIKKKNISVNDKKCEPSTSWNDNSSQRDVTTDPFGKTRLELLSCNTTNSGGTRVENQRPIKFISISNLKTMHTVNCSTKFIGGFYNTKFNNYKV